MSIMDFLHFFFIISGGMKTHSVLIFFSVFFIDNVKGVAISVVAVTVLLPLQ
jgi:hypothetical protein